MKCRRLAVLTLLALFSFSLFGCGKKHVLDGPGMERQVWREFTIAQSSDVYEQNFSYTVKIDENSGEGYLYTEVYNYEEGYPEEKSILLKQKTVNALMNLDILSFPNEIPYESEESILDGTFLSFSVTDQNGTVFKKILSSEQETEILALIMPYKEELEGETLTP